MLEGKRGIAPLFTPDFPELYTFLFLHLEWSPDPAPPQLDLSGRKYTNLEHHIQHTAVPGLSGTCGFGAETLKLGRETEAPSRTLQGN